MGIAYFPSLQNDDTIEVTFDKRQGGNKKLRLLVDTGFTGQSGFVLPADADELAQSDAAPSRVTGALQGTQPRAVVSCRVEALSFQTEAIAIFADMSKLVLPDGVHGIVGLRFLPSFRRWGAEQDSDGAWRFFLETASE